MFEKGVSEARNKTKVCSLVQTYCHSHRVFVTLERLSKTLMNNTKHLQVFARNSKKFSSNARYTPYQRSQRGGNHYYNMYGETPRQSGHRTNPFLGWNMPRPCRRNSNSMTRGNHAPYRQHKQGARQPAKNTQEQK